jgi:hypothetical protein
MRKRPPFFGSGSFLLATMFKVITFVLVAAWSSRNTIVLADDFVVAGYLPGKFTDLQRLRHFFLRN